MSPIKRSTSQPPAKKQSEVALVVGRHGIGEKIAEELAKRMNVVITYVAGLTSAQKTTHRILSAKEVPDNRNVQSMKFDPDESDGAKNLVKQVVEKLGRLDVVVFASIYDSPAKDQIFKLEVSAFYAIYHAAITVRKDGFRVIHISDRVSKVHRDVDAAIEALVRVFGEELHVFKDATVNAVRRQTGNVTDDDIVKMVAHLVKPTSWFINGQVIRRIKSS